MEKGATNPFSLQERSRRIFGETAHMHTCTHAHMHTHAHTHMHTHAHTDETYLAI